jgi:Zn-dependent protease with chaperone function
MGLKLASSFAVIFLFGLIYAVVFVIGVWFLPSDLFGLLLMLGFTILIVLFQYGISPFIIRLIYRIEWYEYEDFTYKYPHLADAVDKVVQYDGIQTPRMGIIHDLNPNAFTFGWTKNSARIVITDGILHYLNKREQKAVIAHELGHVVHSDFILMTVVFAIPLILLTIARWSYYAARFTGSSRRSREGDSGNYIGLILIAIAAISYISYYIGYLVSLLVSRIREYYADQHSAEITNNPNDLSTALIKIAYGLLVSGTQEEMYEKRKSPVRALRGLGIFEPNKSSLISTQSIIGLDGQISKKAVEAAAGWDLYNPWAKYFQLFSTHPLPAKRIQRLNRECEIYGVSIEYDLSGAKKIKEEQAGKSMLDEFLVDVTLKNLPWLIFFILLGLTVLQILSIVGLFSWQIPLFMSNFTLFWALGFFAIGVGVIARAFFKYHTGFQFNNVVELVSNVKVSPIRTVPTVIEGRIVGRGIPGYYFSEDLFFQDNTGLMYIDYRYGLPFVDFFWAITKAKRLIGENVRITGWYRRGPNPYIQVDTIETESGRQFRNYAKHMAYIFSGLFFVIGAFLFYLWFTAL